MTSGTGPVPAAAPENAPHGASGAGSHGASGAGSHGASGAGSHGASDGASGDVPGLSGKLPARVPLNNPANLLTALRLLLVPVFVLLAMASEMNSPGWRVAACLTFGVASFTDFVDGWIARRFALVTAFGKVADPIADKALTGSALILLSGYGMVPWWVTVLILVREVGVTLMRFWVIRYGVIAASRGGKAKTSLQILAIAWYLWPFPEPAASVAPWIMAVAVAVTVITGLDYALRALRLRRRG